MEGGRLIGTGTYGCVFQPPLLCKSRHTAAKDRVGKITSHEETSAEITISNRLRKVPLVDNYLVLVDPEECELAPKEQQTETGLSECTVIERRNEYQLRWQNARQIFSPFRGYTSFYKFMISNYLKPTQFDFFAFMQHILEAGSTLLIGGVCHYDLHPGNMLIDENGVVRILDFGFSFLADSITKKTIEEHWRILRFGIEKNAPVSAVIDSEAPEITIFNAERHQIPYADGIQSVVNLKHIFRTMEKFLGMSRKVSEEELNSFWEANPATQQHDEVALFQHYWPGFDAWAIGACLLDVCSKLLMFPAFAEDELPPRQTAVYATLRGLLQPDPRKRLDCIEALAVFDPNSDWIRRFGQKWLTQKEEKWRSQKANLNVGDATQEAEL